MSIEETEIMCPRCMTRPAESSVDDCGICGGRVKVPLGTVLRKHAEDSEMMAKMITQLSERLRALDRSVRHKKRYK